MYFSFRFLDIYIFLWLLLTVIGIIMMFSGRRKLLLLKKEYFHFLLRPWKITTFIVATSLLSYISTLGYDPTWDIPETLIMAILTYWTAPYSIGTLQRHFFGVHKNNREIYIAFILLLFSSAWFYDAYAGIFLIGEYPPTAFANLGLSPIFYSLAGMMWSLDYNTDSGAFFAYTKDGWVNVKWEKGVLQHTTKYWLPIMVFMFVVFWTFVFLNMK